ncbi:MAG: hypothetical protein CALGDGBN_00214 [Pseudomonadales bacterium]|nr:hypothetical protein [Pseudomonadales bacterium]
MATRAGAAAPAAGSAAASTGSSTVNTLPRPGSLAASMPPPSKVQNSRHSASPRPVPPYFLVVEESACTKASKTLCNCSVVMPMPVSRTRSRSQSRPPRTNGAISSVTVPSAVNLQALLSRFAKICRKRVWSLTMRALAPSGTSITIVLRLWAASVCMVAASSRSTSTASKGSR